MAGLISLGVLTLILTVLFENGSSSPVNISPQSVPESLIQSAINSLNADSPTQHTYRGGNLISAQKLLEPNLIVYRLTLNLDTICGEGLTTCPREACAIDLKDRSGNIEIDRNSIQCMYLYPQSTQEDAQQVQQTEGIRQDTVSVESSGSDNAEDNRSASQNTLELDHEVEAAAGSERSETDSPDNKPFIAVRAPNSNYCAGCPYELNPNLPGLTAFGVQALDMMDRLGQNDFKHKLIRILKVTRAVPPGSNVVRYKLLAEIGETNCLKITLIERSECSLQANTPVRVCLITFEERPWQQSDRQVVGNNCTVPSDLENEINAGLNPVLNGNSYLVGNGQPERVDSVQEVIGKTAHIDQLAQEGKIGTYDSLIDQILESPAANATPEVNITDVPFFEGVIPRERFSYVPVRRETVQETNEERQSITELPFVRVELERADDTQQVPGFVDKEREFDEFLADFDIPIRDTVTEITEGNRQPVTEELIRPQKVVSDSVAENVSSSSEEEDESVESAESGENVDEQRRTKRSLIKVPSSDRLLVKKLAQKAVDTLDDIDQDDDKRVVLNILESRRQKADGFLYHLIIEVALTDCSEMNREESDTDCLDRIIGPIKICKVQIHTDEKDPLLSARVIKSECSKVMTKEKNARSKRDFGLVGAPDAISIDDDAVKNYTKIGLDKLSETFEGPNEPILVKIMSAFVQIVAGTLHKIKVEVGTSNCAKGEKENCQLQADSEKKECEITAWSRPWLSEGALDIKVNCDTNARTRRSLEHQELRKRREVGLPGSPNAVSIEGEDVKKYAKLGLDKLSETYEGPNEPILVKIMSAFVQIVAGTLHKIKVEVGTSNCAKGEKENCQLQADSEKKECEITAWSRPWLSEGALDIKVNCDTNARTRRSLEHQELRKRREVGLPGSPNAVSIEGEDVKKYAKLGLDKLSETYEGPNEPILVKIMSAFVQIVAGTLHKIKVEVGTSNCAKGEKENCQLQADSEKKECEVTAWSRPWLSEGALDIKVNCDSNARARRSLEHRDLRKKRALTMRGSPNAISIEDDDVKNFVSLGLKKFSENSEGSNEPILMATLNATKQVVAGSLYKINVRLGTSDCPKGTTENCQLQANSETKECQITALSRPWLSEGALDIKVNCNSKDRSKRGLRGKNYSQKMLQQSLYLKNERLFSDFLVKYNKSYSSLAERKNRFKIFHQNMNMVQELQRNEQGTATYGVSMFADLTTEEFKKNYLGLKPELRQDNEIPIPMAEIPEIEIPDEYDWRNYNVVTPVKNQGSCGSCWAFSVTGNVEGQYALRHGSLLSLSEQELVDCDTLDEGCNGGLPDNAYRAIEKLGGLELESDYPYDGENEACHFNKTVAKVKVVSAVNITTNETQMAQWLVKNGPISIGINANAMQFYMGGVSHPFKFLCSPNNLDHGVLIVGYGIHTYPIFHKTLPYWTIKNSWGESWGEQGYYRVYRGDGTCGVNQMASSAVVA